MPVHRFSLAGSLALVLVAACFVLIVLERTRLIPQLEPVTTALYSWTVLLAAFALLLGVANVMLVHLRRVYRGEREWSASLALVVALLVVLVTGLLDEQGTGGPLVEWLFDALIAPGQATLFALLAFFTAAAGYRYLRIGRRAGAWMLAGVLITGLAQWPVWLLPPAAHGWVDWWLMAPVMAVFRGALLGGGLALILAGVRFLLGRTEV
jgi:hypothetical protein